MPFVNISGAADGAAHFPVNSAVKASSPADVFVCAAKAVWAALRTGVRTDRMQQLSPGVLL